MQKAERSRIEGPEALSAGKHTITLKLTDYADWTRELTVEPSSEVQLTATLDKH